MTQNLISERILLAKIKNSAAASFAMPSIVVEIFK
jgi:hypothetical protein